jgi:hypothetical protein
VDHSSQGDRFASVAAEAAQVVDLQVDRRERAVLTTGRRAFGERWTFATAGRRLEVVDSRGSRRFGFGKAFK